MRDHLLIIQATQQKAAASFELIQAINNKVQSSQHLLIQSEAILSGNPTKLVKTIG